MPVSIHKVKGGKYRVSTPHGVHAKGTTLAKAQAQSRLLRAVDHGWHPTGHKAESMTNQKCPEECCHCEDNGASKDGDVCPECGLIVCDSCRGKKRVESSAKQLVDQALKEARVKEGFASDDDLYYVGEKAFDANAEINGDGSPEYPEDFSCSVNQQYMNGDVLEIRGFTTLDQDQQLFVRHVIAKYNLSEVSPDELMIPLK